jgi:hypothetical protein
MSNPSERGEERSLEVPPPRDFNKPVGKVGDFGVQNAQNAEFIIRNKKTKEIERIFGFEELLHEQGDQWEVKGPFVEVFMPDFKVDIRADSGSIRVESVDDDRVSPKDARFVGNVVIRVTGGGGRLRESSIYLDEVIFLSQKSEVSSTGPVRYVATNAEMKGTGLKLVYNDRLRRLDVLRVNHVEFLRFKNEKAAPFPRQRPAATRAMTDDTETVAHAKRIIPKVSDEPNAAPAEAGNKAEFYKLILSKNVTVDSPQQWIFARERISIEDILWTHTRHEEDTADRTTGKGLPEPKATPTGDLRKGDVADQPQYSAETFVNCENGILLLPADSNRSISDFIPSADVMAPTGDAIPEASESAAVRGRLVARSINHSLSNGHTVVSGPLEMVFYPNDLPWAEPNEATAEPTPVTITAENRAGFLPDARQAVFEGDVNCTMVRTEPNSVRSFRLSAPLLTLDLVESPTEAKAADAELRRLSASGGTVRLSAVRRTASKLLGGVELRCTRFEYTPDAPRCYAATGPGVLKAHNARRPGPNETAVEFNAQSSYWTVLQGFEDFKFFVDENRIVVSAEPEEMLDIKYVPIIDGSYGEVVTAGAARIEALLLEDSNGTTDVSSVAATGGVDYIEGDKHFAGSRLFYDHGQDAVTINGDESMPCLLNGVLVDSINYNLKTGEVSAEIVAPGGL